MTRRPTLNSAGWQRGLQAAAGGLLLGLAFPPYNLPWLLPAGVIVFLRALARTESGRATFVAGFIAGIAYFGTTLFWLAHLFGAGALTLVALVATFPALFAVLFRFLHRRLPCIPKWLIASVLWTGIEYYRSELFALKFGWLGLGYSLANAPAPLKLASWFGSYSLTFLAVAAGAAVALRSQSVRRCAAYGAGLVFSWLVLVHIPCPRVPGPNRPLNVRLVQADASDLETLFCLSEAPANRGWKPDFIVWPEYSIPADPRHDPGLWRRLRDLAVTQRAYLLFGATEKAVGAPPAQFWNTAYLLDPAGRLAGTHRKNHPVHLMRDGLPGAAAKAISTPYGRVGIGICFDMDFPDVARRLAADGAEFFLVPNMDPAEWGTVQKAQHTLMFQMRAAECGRWLARADVAGGTSVYAPTGHETFRVNTPEAQPCDVRIGRIAKNTAYVRGGWRFGQACLTLGLLLCGWALMRNATAAVPQGPGRQRV